MSKRGDPPLGDFIDLNTALTVEGEEADLPGLESDQPTESAEAPGAAKDSGERIDNAIEEWKDALDAERESHERSHADLDEWFENVFGGHKTFRERQIFNTRGGLVRSQ